MLYKIVYVFCVNLQMPNIYYKIYLKGQEHILKFILDSLLKCIWNIFIKTYIISIYFWYILKYFKIYVKIFLPQGIVYLKACQERKDRAWICGLTNVLYVERHFIINNAKSVWAQLDHIRVPYYSITGIKVAFIPHGAVTWTFTPFSLTFLRIPADVENWWVLINKHSFV